MDKNTKPAEARAALGLGDMGPFDLVDALKQEYRTRQEQAEHIREDGKIGAVRIHTGVMAALADLLSRYYQDTGDCVLAATWAARAVRQQRRAFYGRNSVAENIGARMP